MQTITENIYSRSPKKQTKMIKLGEFTRKTTGVYSAPVTGSVKYVEVILCGQTPKSIFDAFGHCHISGYVILMKHDGDYDLVSAKHAFNTILS